MFGWREVYMSSSITDCDKILKALEKNGIRYQYKIRSASGDINGHMSALDSQAAMAFIHYLYVKKQDYEQAKYFAGCALRGGED